MSASMVSVLPFSFRETFYVGSHSHVKQNTLISSQASLPRLCSTHNLYNVVLLQPPFLLILLLGCLQLPLLPSHKLQCRRSPTLPTLRI